MEWLAWIILAAVILYTAWSIYGLIKKIKEIKKLKREVKKESINDNIDTDN